MLIHIPLAELFEALVNVGQAIGQGIAHRRRACVG